MKLGKTIRKDRVAAIDGEKGMSVLTPSRSKYAKIQEPPAVQWARMTMAQSFNTDIVHRKECIIIDINFRQPADKRCHPLL